MSLHSKGPLPRQRVLEACPVAMACDQIDVCERAYFYTWCKHFKAMVEAATDKTMNRGDHCECQKDHKKVTECLYPDET